MVCFDPIDGSSNIDAAVTTGSIWGVYKPAADECKLNLDDTPDTVLEKCVKNAQKTGESLACAGYVLYSSSTVMMLTVGAGVFGFTLEWCEFSDPLQIWPPRLPILVPEGTSYLCPDCLSIHRDIQD